MLNEANIYGVKTKFHLISLTQNILDNFNMSFLLFFNGHIESPTINLIDIKRINMAYFKQFFELQRYVITLKI